MSPVTVKLELLRPLPETDEFVKRVAKRLDGAERRSDDPEWATFEFDDEEIGQEQAEARVREALEAEDPDWGEKVAFSDPDEEDDDE
jgi:hypothetical protein